MGIREIQKEGSVFKMELKNLSENCLDCKCRTCKLDNNSSCYTWCEENCKGEEPLDFKPDKECYERMERDYGVSLSDDVMENNYCEHINDKCEYVVVCKNYDGICAKDMLGNYFRTEGYLPEDILARIKRYEEKEKNKIYEYMKV